jgi:hypothetical protein
MKWTSTFDVSVREEVGRSVEDRPKELVESAAAPSIDEKPKTDVESTTIPSIETTLDGDPRYCPCNIHDPESIDFLKKSGYLTTDDVGPLLIADELLAWKEDDIADTASRALAIAPYGADINNIINLRKGGLKDVTIEVHSPYAISSLIREDGGEVKAESWDGSNIYVTKRGKDRDVIVMRSRYSDKRVILGGFVGKLDDEDRNAPSDDVDIPKTDVKEEVAPDEKKDVPLDGDKQPDPPKVDLDKTPDPLKVDLDQKLDPPKVDLVNHPDLVDYKLTPSMFCLYDHSKPYLQLLRDNSPNENLAQDIVKLLLHRVEPICSCKREGSSNIHTDTFYRDRLGVRLADYQCRLTAYPIPIGCFVCRRPLAFPPYKWSDPPEPITFETLGKKLEEMKKKAKGVASGSDTHELTTRDAMKVLVRDDVMTERTPDDHWVVKIFGHSSLSYTVKGKKIPHVDSLLGERYCLLNHFLVCSLHCMTHFRKILYELIELKELSTCKGCDCILQDGQREYCTSGCRNSVIGIEGSSDEDTQPVEYVSAAAQ